MTESWASEREVQLRATAADAIHAEIFRRLSAVEAESSQVNVLAVQVTNISEKLGGVNKRMDDHEKRHAREAAERKADRRWLVASVLIPTLAVVVSAGGIILALH